MKAGTTSARLSAAGASPDFIKALGHELRALDTDASCSVRRFRAYAEAIAALLPKEPSGHPALSIFPGMSEADRQLRFDLRDALTAARGLTEALRERADLLEADVDMALEKLFGHLELPRGEA